MLLVRGIQSSREAKVVQPLGCDCHLALLCLALRTEWRGNKEGVCCWGAGRGWPVVYSSCTEGHRVLLLMGLGKAGSREGSSEVHLNPKEDGREGQPRASGDTGSES